MDTPTATPSLEQQIPIGLLHPNPDQPRHLFERNALDELAASIRQYGLLQPLVVRPTDGGSFQLIAGERRWRAAQLAGLEELPCRVLRDIDDLESFILSVTENVARRDMTVLEEAKAYERIITLGHTVEQVAELFGKTVETIRYRLDLLELREDVQELVTRNQISRGVAWYLSRISHAGQAEVIRKMNAGELATDDAACRFAAAVRMREESPDMFGGQAKAEGDEWTEQRRRTQRGKIQVAWSKIEALGASFAPFLELGRDELALAIGVDTPLYHQRLQVLDKTVRRTTALLAQAAAFHQVTRGEAAS